MRKMANRGAVQISLFTAILLTIIVTGAIVFAWREGSKREQAAPTPLPNTSSKDTPTPESQALKIERCKALAELQSKQSSDAYAVELWKAANENSQNSTPEEKQNMTELIKTWVAKAKVEDYNRFYSACLQ